jgi:hypothetical protein
MIASRRMLAKLFVAPVTARILIAYRMMDPVCRRNNAVRLSAKTGYKKYSPLPLTFPASIVAG